jgi:hypothetical protein
MVDRWPLHRDKARLRLFGGIRKALWAVYAAVILRLAFDPETGIWAWVLVFATLALAEASLIDLDLAIEVEKERLKEEYGEELNWIVDLGWR